MHKNIAQNLLCNEQGELSIEYDWYPAPLPKNIHLDEMTYPDTAYSFATFHSEKKDGFKLGYASGNYGHSIIMAGKSGVINVGKYVVLECTNLISNSSIFIGDHCMFSWGSIVTDSWLNLQSSSIGTRREMLKEAAHSKTRHVEFLHPKPVIIEENVWVGFDAIIMPGVHLGRGCIVGCKAVVREDVPPYAVVTGNPARTIKYLEANDTDEAKQEALRTLLVV
ncbi:acyltransferase [Aridibaculum aurantiacum]|uniref:acyltransferase n=1 Tax=Aridibaculum aurantiacum TaxID=2810307 RepID=UPI001A960338|nr:acyltransferase [Aridibaculum aurantiacum]